MDMNKIKEILVSYFKNIEASEEACGVAFKLQTSEFVDPDDSKAGHVIDTYDSDSAIKTTLVCLGPHKFSEVPLSRDDQTFIYNIHRLVEGQKWETVQNPDCKTPETLLTEGVLKEGDIIKFTDLLGNHVMSLETYEDDYADAQGLFFVGPSPISFIEDIDDETSELVDDDDDDDEEEEDAVEEICSCADHEHDVEIGIHPLTSLLACAKRLTDVIVKGAKIADFDD